MPTVHFPRHLIHQLAMPTSCQASGTTLAEVVADIERQFPGVWDYVIDPRGGLRDHVNLFIGQQWVKDRRELSDQVAESDEITVMQALAGG